MKSKKGHNTRQLIIDKATALFTQKGYSQTSLSQILFATGLTKGGFYFHFTSKEELGFAVIDYLEACWTSEILPQMMQGKDARQKLDLMFNAPGDCCNSSDRVRPTILLLTLATEMAEVNSIFGSRLRAIFEGWLLMLEAVIEEGKLQQIVREDVNSSAVAAIILSNIMGANLLALLNGRTEIYYQQLHTLQSVLFEGITKKS